MLYIHNYYPIIRYEDIDTKNKYYGLFSNALIIDDALAFYMSYMLVYMSSAVIEYTNNKGTLIMLWSTVNIISPLVMWLYHAQIYKYYGVYVIAFEDGIISTVTCLLMFITVDSIIHNELENHDISNLQVSIILFITWFMLNMINIGFYDSLYHPLNVNLGYLTAFMFVNC